MKKISYSDQEQDLFALGICENGSTFLDVGASHPIRSNNTYLLEQLGWQGICVEIQDHIEDQGKEVKIEDLYEQNRTSKLYKLDSTSEGFLDALDETYKTGFIDYISLDVDEASIKTLKNIFQNGYNCKCITFEHDLYTPNGSCDEDRTHRLKFESKDFLQERGYFPLFENVSLSQFEALPWEDWWINLNYGFKFKSISCKNAHYGHCIEILTALLESNKCSDNALIKYLKSFKR